MAGKTKTRSQEIREEVGTVTVFATCGHLPLVPDQEDWINPTTKKVTPEVALWFEDGICVLDPSKPEDKKVLDVFIPWYEDREDDRIGQHSVQLVAKSGLRRPYPKWDDHTVSKCLAQVDENGYDPEECLRYELSKESPRESLVTKLEALVDKPVAEDPTQVPEID